MHPENSDLRQTGFSIKKSWQQLLAGWVQPELDLHERLFEGHYNKGNESYFMDLPVIKTMEEVSRFFDKLSIVQWPFETDESPIQPMDENETEYLRGKRKFPLIQPGSPLAGTYTKWQRGAVESNEKSASDHLNYLVHPGKTSEAIEQQNQEEMLLRQNQNLEHKSAGEKEYSTAEQKKGTLESTDENRIDARLENEEIPNPFSEEELLVPHVEKGKNQSGKARHQPPKFIGDHLKGIVEFPEPVSSRTIEGDQETGKIKAYQNQPAFFQQEKENSTNTERQIIELPEVKSLQNLGAWLRENESDETIENKSPEGLSFQKQGSYPAYNNTFETQPLSYSDHADHHHTQSIAHNEEPDSSLMRIDQQVSSFFGEPFSFLSEPSISADTEDLIQELTEQLNREYKRFYGP